MQGYTLLYQHSTGCSPRQASVLKIIPQKIIFTIYNTDVHQIFSRTYTFWLEMAKLSQIANTSTKSYETSPRSMYQIYLRCDILMVSTF